MRPYISTCARLVQLVPVALRVACLLTVTAVPVTAAFAASGSADLASSTSALPGTPPTALNTGLSASLSTPRVRLHLGIHRTTLDVLDGTAATVSGALLPARANRVIALQVLSHGRWRTVARAVTGHRGRFALRYVPRRIFNQRVQLRYGGNAVEKPVRRALGRLRVYRLVAASWYGGGGSLACGGYLTSWTMGVANKTLPCGTMVTLRYGGRSVRVPVVDRGPYVAGREFDLTEATKRALGFEGVGDVWSSR